MNPKEETRRISKSTNVVYLITTLIVVVSSMFKIMHWQYSEELGVLRNIAFITAFAAVLYEKIQLKKIIKR